MTTNFEETDFFNDESLFGDPYPYFDYLRETKGPVWIDTRYNMAVVTGHAEEVAILRNPEVFSSCNSPTGPFSGVDLEIDGDDAFAVVEQHRAEMPLHEYMVTMDPPLHDEYRGLMTRFFTPRRLKENEDYMWKLADEQMKPFIDTGKVEFSNAYASPFAGLVIADLLGVPSEDMPRFRDWFQGQIADVGEDTASMPQDPLSFFQDSFASYISERRQTPHADILTNLAEARFSDGSEPEVTALARESAFIFAAGQETTVRLLTFSLRYIAEHPEVQELLRNDRERIPTFLEEMLRLESPIKAHFRLARRTTTVGDTTIKAGMSVMLLNGASNRDPRRFECPAEAKTDRTNARDHLAFSRGVHVCLGQSLARAEGRVTLERVLDRMADIKISEEKHGPPGARKWEYLPTWLFRGLTDLNLEFTPIGA